MYMDEKENIPHVVILGAGFLGIKLAKNLLAKYKKKVSITLISERDYFIYYPNLYASLSFDYVSKGKNEIESYIPLSEIFREDEISLVIDSVVSIDTNKKCNNE